MSEKSIKTAIKYGEKLKEFSDQSEAERYFLSYKDDMLNRLKELCGQNPGFDPDFTVESLKKIEKRYFELCEENAFEKTGTTQEEFERILAVYWGEVAVQNDEEAKWTVQEFAFSGGRYELLVNKGLCSVSIGNNFRDLYKAPRNTRRDRLYREYKRYFS